MRRCTGLPAILHSLRKSCMSSHDDHQKGLLLTAIGGLTLTVDIPLIRLADGGAWTILLLRTGTTFVAALIIWAVWRALSRNAPQLIPGLVGLDRGRPLRAWLDHLRHRRLSTPRPPTSSSSWPSTPCLQRLLSWLFLKERPRPVTLAAWPLMILGVAIIVGGSIGTGHLFGDLMALCSAFFDRRGHHHLARQRQGHGLYRAGRRRPAFCGRRVHGLREPAFR